MAHLADRAEAARDPRLLSRWYFLAFGGCVAVALVLVRVHILFLLLAGIGLATGALLAQRRGAYLVDERTRGTIALRSPLPGTMVPAITALALLLLAAQVNAGSFGPERGVPVWVAVGIACAVGAATGLLLRRSELMRLAGTRRLEGRAG